MNFHWRSQSSSRLLCNDYILLNDYHLQCTRMSIFWTRLVQTIWHIANLYHYMRVIDFKLFSISYSGLQSFVSSFILSQISAVYAYALYKDLLKLYGRPVKVGFAKERSATADLDQMDPEVQFILKIADKNTAKLRPSRYTQVQRHVEQAPSSQHA